ncbi:MAG: 3,4-dihydroxy-2-butanone-4-phosphate synthase [Gammaproteobacteria bacterium]|nr:3,4-dihydroxy-2-butanone-4-phosphate synthase [Gammaproteobacteria bacterium]
MSENKLSTIETAINAIKSGKMVIVVDDEDRENEGDFVMAGDFCDSAAVNFMITHGRGLVCLAMAPEMIDRLKIPMMVPDAQNSSGFGTGFTISVEAKAGVSTGISAPDRAQTIKTLIDPSTTPNDIAMPGHIFPLRAKRGGVLERRGQTEASVDLARLAGLTPAGVICEVMKDDGEMMRLDDLLAFAQVHDMPVISVEDLAQYREQHEKEVTASGERTEHANWQQIVSVVGKSQLPTKHGNFDITIYRDAQGMEHSALVSGDLSKGKTPLVRIHSECLTGDAFGSKRCDCGEQLEKALADISSVEGGILVYLRQEGRGIGLGNKIRAYSLQDEGLDTVEANHQLGFPADARTYDAAAAILQHLGVESIQLLTNNPEKHSALDTLGIRIERLIPLQIPAQFENANYLKTKATRMGHSLPESLYNTTSSLKGKKNGTHD